ncbi:non-homologous end-joining DNA ligase [Parapedobacter lycopersici]|uniref:non-homologous end-joining DNA ligase n=1 Tax=Parapedobacter lycopersici TaxID=1864939 RepID=UPI00214DA00B|nr:non-homologous end-joining DNA ligase [Parapedobacter lycopersici]
MAAKRQTTTEMPDRISPMLCTLVKQPLNNPEYLYEIKWDGYRIVSFVQKKHVRMASRNGLDYTKRYPLIEAALKDLGHEVIIDGEVVVFDEHGMADFDALQLYNGKRTPIRYCVFDLLWLDGNDLRPLPLAERKELLRLLVKKNSVLQFSESVDDGSALYRKVLEENREGVIAKRRESSYQEGIRNNDWLKVPTRKRQEFVIGGWADSDKSRAFKNLLFGAYEDGRLVWIGRSGSGYKEKEMREILDKLKALERDTSPFVNRVLDTKGAISHWVEPKLIANFEFATWTKSGRIRKPATFLGFRDDKKPTQVVRELPKPLTEIEAETEAGAASLGEYYGKRTFADNPEPTGGKPSDARLRFVVQQHRATSLHYDLRLEMGGVLKSWAVPKGPSIDPAVKRLAMMTEDHPFDYRNFEGVIPKGNYGAGAMIIWDEGTYQPVGNAGTKTEQDREMRRQWHKGAMKFKLNGSKLKGEYALARTKGRAENAWLLIKLKDRYAGDTDITENNKSVRSGHTVETLAKPKAMTTPKKRTATARQRKPLLDTAGKEAVVTVDGHELKLTNLNKVFWPDAGYTKRDLLNYYHQVAPYILPYLKDRPQSLNRFPNGIRGKSFYQKDVTGKVPGWIDKYPYRSEDEDRRKNFMLGNNEASLLYMANLAAIEMNPWSSTIRKPDHPDWCILDLDPDKGNTFEQVIQVARVIKDVLDEVNIPGYCKTSGSTGLHIYIPLGAKYTYDQSQLLARWIAVHANGQLDFTSVARMTDKRKGKIYIDFLQNRPSATLAAPYSLRPKPGATVSMPLHWDEVKQGLDMRDFNLANALDRIRENGDIFKPVLGKGIDLKKILKNLE